MQKKSKYTPPFSVIDRVAIHLDDFAKSTPSNACWIWPMGKTKSGYGQLMGRANGKTYGHYAHRVSMFIRSGAIPPGVFVCHRCDNPGCINPEHLFLGTAKDNALDCKAKGRNRKGRKFHMGERHWTKRTEKRFDALCGENHYNSVLTWDIVRKIRASNEKGAALARRYGVTRSTISGIRKRKSWATEA